jgi:phospholipid-binding lipoprotein MlaA
MQRTLSPAGLFTKGAAIATLLLLAACASPPENDPDALAAYEEANDPLEPANRYVFEVNYAADELLLKPFAGWYYAAIPNYGQDRIRNVLRNLNTPVILANDLFQGEMDRANTTVMRFLINSTVGVAGIWDVATDWGYPYHTEDFGQTLAVHGAGEGPYLMVPILGPSNPRDASGMVVDIFLDPMTYFGSLTTLQYARAGLEGLDTRARNLTTLDEIRRGSVDYYATIRSLYRQYRNDEIRNGAPPEDDIFNTTLREEETSDPSQVSTAE